MSDQLRLHENTFAGRSVPASLSSTAAVPCAATKPAAESRLIVTSKQSVDTPLRIESLERDGSIVLVVRGELDIVTSPLLDEALRVDVTDAAQILVDLEKVSFIDSTGLHVLIKHARAESGRPRIRVIKSSPQVQRLFELSGVADYLPFVSE